MWGLQTLYFPPLISLMFWFRARNFPRAPWGATTGAELAIWEPGVSDWHSGGTGCLGLYQSPRALFGLFFWLVGSRGASGQPTRYIFFSVVGVGPWLKNLPPFSHHAEHKE